jgi:hypothetical protein
MTDSPKHDTKAGTSNLRQFVLIGLLVLLVIALVYDYKVVRPSVNTAYDRIAEESMLKNMRSTEVFTNKDVQELLAKTPSRTFEESNGNFVEVYSWRSGLPIRTHDLFAVYKKNGENWLFDHHTKYEHEPAEEVYRESNISEPIEGMSSEARPSAAAAAGGSSDEAYRASGPDDSEAGGDAEGDAEADRRPEAEADAEPAAADEQP